MSLVWDDSADGAEWRTTVQGRGWWSVYAADGEDRVVYSGPDIHTAEALAAYERDRCGRAVRESTDNSPTLGSGCPQAPQVTVDA